MDIDNYKMDRNAFQALTLNEADKQIKYGSNASLHERSVHFNYLMSIAYQFPSNNWPRMDKSHFEIIKRN